MKGATNMPHKPPKKDFVVDSLAPHPVDIPIEVIGTARSIDITLPSFTHVTNDTSISLGGEGFKVNQNSTAHSEETFNSRITRIELKEVKPVPGQPLAFKPVSAGRCRIKIFFEHP